MRKLRPWQKWLVYLGLGLVALLICGCAWVLFALAQFFAPTNDRDNVDPARQAEMLTILIQAGPLAPVPAGATMGRVYTEGNMFARRFHAGFTAPPSVIKRWVAASPGLDVAHVEKDATTTLYTIDHPVNHPTSGERVTVAINWAAGQVVLYMETG